MYDLPDKEDLEEVVVSAETVKDGKQPVYVYADKKKKKEKVGKDADKEAEAS